MSSATVMQSYRLKEQAVFSKIPGMFDLIYAKGEAAEKISLEFPDASFALRIANSLFHHDRELSLIHQRAYFAILNGEPIASVRHRFNQEVSLYVKEHNWDD